MRSVRIQYIIGFQWLAAGRGFDVQGEGISLSDAGLGSDIHLVVPVDNPFEGSGYIKPLHDLSHDDDESLPQEPVPSDFRSSPSFGEFALVSSFIENGASSKGHEVAPAEFVQISVDRTATELSSAAEFRELDNLNQQMDSVHVAAEFMPREDRIVAMVDYVSVSGPASVDFEGLCVSGYLPFSKASVNSIDECWSACRSNIACTQVHFSEMANTCYLSHGISVRASSGNTEDIAMPYSMCRSLTPSGLRFVNRGSLPSFRELPNNKVFLGSNSSVAPLSVSSLGECQSACMDASSCQFGVWIAKSSGKNQCILASAIAPYRCPVGVSECVQTCGTEDCLLFERNLLNMAGPANMQGLSSSAVSASAASFPENLSVTMSCESKCKSTVSSESPCVSLCLMETRSLCQAACARQRKGCVAVGFLYGNRSQQTCVGYTAVPSVNTTTVQSNPSGRLVDIFILPQEATTASTISLIQSGSSIRRLSKYLSPQDIRPNFQQFAGPCDVFSEGLISTGIGAGLSRFRASSVEDCWRLCESFSKNQCSQIQFHKNSNECVLGDAIAKTFRADGNTICRSLEYMPVSSSNGLSGMLLVDSVAGTGGSQNWFTNAAAPVLVNSLEECQALCKAADAGASDAVCRFGGYADCSSFHSSFCQGVGASHPDCGLCDKNPAGGVCRIPQIPVNGQSTKQAATSALPCAGGKCRWFERSTTGFSLQVSTGSNVMVDYSPQSVKGIFCDSLSYLPNSKTYKSAQGSGCYYPVESLWHCETLCQAINKVNGKTSCVAGLYRDKQGKKQCRLARYKSITGKACDGNCGWFELAGEGKTAGLEDTGAGVAEISRNFAPNLFTMGLGPCQQFRALDAVITNTPSGFQFSPIEDCSRACAYFPQCTSYQVTGSVSGGAPGATCDILKGKESDCTFITCTLSTALSVAVPSGNNMTLCWTKTPLGTTASGDEDIDMDIDPGIPGYITTNARVRRFGWDDVLNKDRLVLTMTLEECQSMCRVSDGCVSGSWQHCQAIEQLCRSDTLPGTPLELQATCNACRKVPVSESQPSVDFPEHLGVCKMASQIKTSTQACFPEPCYAFEEGSENYFIMSTSKSAFLLPDGTVNAALLNIAGEPGTYIKAKSLSECQEACTSDPNCRYGHLVPRTTGFGECYLSAQEVRVNDGQRFRMKDPQNCDGQCIVFMKLPTRLPANMFAPKSALVQH